MSTGARRCIPPMAERVSLHKTYLSDVRRNAAYRAAISRAVHSSSVVVDLGSGSGILGFFALQAGCRRLYSVERSDFIHHARTIAERNDFAGRTEFIQADLFDVQLPEKADVLIHEQVGAYVWEENLVEKLVHARERLLAPGGIILPYRVSLFLVPVVHRTTLRDRQFWSTPLYGIDFSHLDAVEQEQAEAMALPRIVHLETDESFLAAPVQVAVTNLYEDRIRPDRLEAEFTIDKPGICSGIAGFFEIRFDDEITLSTAPSSTPTNWHQFLLPVTDQRSCKPGDRFALSVDVADAPHEWDWGVRWL